VADSFVIEGISGVIWCNIESFNSKSWSENS